MYFMDVYLTNHRKEVNTNPARPHNRYGNGAGAGPGPGGP